MEKFDLFAGASMQLPFDEFTMGICNILIFVTRYILLYLKSRYFISL
jgi:hypothetical protein